MFDSTIEFIRTLYEASPGKVIPLHAPTFAGNERKYLEECIDTTFVSSVGAFVDRFEQMIAEYTGAAGAVVTVNGTAALHMALMLAGVGSGDLVITQALTFIATCNAIAYTGADPVFVDVDHDTMGLSPDALEQWLADNTVRNAEGECIHTATRRRLRACVVMHTFGHPARVERLLEICRAYGIELVEDAAESIGSLRAGRHTGTFAPIGALSFNGNKTITTGGGGMLLFSDAEMARRAKHLTTQAKVPHRWEFVHDSVGYNYRMPNINAALGCAQLEQLPDFLRSKRATASAYAGFFADGHDGIRFMPEPAGTRSNYWLCAVELPDRAARDAFLTATNDAGVMTRPIWELMNRLPMWKDAISDELTVTRRLADTIVNIPSGVRAVE